MGEYPVDPVSREICGTYAGWNQHQRHGERECRPCLDAAAQYQRQRRRRGRCYPGLGWPLGPGDIAPRDRRQ